MSNEMTQHPSSGTGSNGSAQGITLRDLIALRDRYAPDAEVSGPMHGPWTIDGDTYERGEDACAALRR